MAKILFLKTTSDYLSIMNTTDVLFTDSKTSFDPEIIITLLAMASIGFILNVAVISIASRRPAFTQVPVKSLVVSLGTANLYLITFCMVLNAAWHTVGVWFDGDCRFYRTVEAFRYDRISNSLLILSEFVVFYCDHVE